VACSICCGTPTSALRPTIRARVVVRSLWWLSDLWLKIAHNGFQLFIHPRAGMRPARGPASFLKHWRYYWWEVAVASRDVRSAIGIVPQAAPKRAARLRLVVLRPTSDGR
jgi:hypothetical protein